MLKVNVAVASMFVSPTVPCKIWELAPLGHVAKAAAADSLMTLCVEEDITWLCNFNRPCSDFARVALII